MLASSSNQYLGTCSGWSLYLDHDGNVSIVSFGNHGVQQSFALRLATTAFFVFHDVVVILGVDIWIGILRCCYYCYYSAFDTFGASSARGDN